MKVRTPLRKPTGLFRVPKVMGCSHLTEATHRKRLEEAMTKFPITRPSRQDPAPRAAVIDISAKKTELQLASRVRSGVLNELELGRWRGLTD